ncbi:MAG: GspH/FimT family pseudopilin [Gammaproteobacteria bacterium]|nr:GspH/FimT family pseudopilin [Gammaproteobacteria bacterium]
MKNFQGFTLVELLVLLAIVAILAVIAVPNFSATIKNDRDISQVNALVDALSLARSEAIKTGRFVTVCPGNTNACSVNNWSDGWIVFNGTPAAGASTTIRVFPALSGNNKLTPVPAATTIVFQSTGMTTLPPGNTINFTLCDGRSGTFARSVFLDSTGHADSSPKMGYAIDGTTALICP